MKTLRALEVRLLVACMASVSALVPFQAIAAQAVYYEGTLESDGWTWHVGLQIGTAVDGRSTVSIDLPSVWRLDLPIESFSKTADSLSFTIPEGLGLAKLKVSPNEMSGMVSMDDGRSGWLVLRRLVKPVVTETEVSLTSSADGAHIAASVFLPAGSGPFPAAVMIHGGGNSSRDLPGYHFWGMWLARHGIAAILYDKRGNGKSASDWRTVDFETRAGDVMAAIAHMRTLGPIDRERVGLVAVSQGSWVANIVAANDLKLGFVVHVSGPAVPVAEADAYAIENRLRGQGASDRVVERHRALWFQQVEAVVAPDNHDLFLQLQRSVAEASNEDWFQAFPYTVGNPQGWWWRWYGLIADFDPIPFVKRSAAPMLWIYGDVDTQSDVERNLTVLQQLRDQHTRTAVAIFPQSGHGLMAPADRFGNPLGPMTVAPGFFQTVFNWINRSKPSSRSDR